MKYVATLAEEINDKLEGRVRVTTRRQLDRLVVETVSEASTVILREDFVNKYFTPSGLVSYINNVRLINKALAFDISDIKGLESVSKFAKRIAGVRDFSELIMLASKYENEFMDTIKTLCKNELRMNDSTLAMESRISTLLATVDAQDKEIEALRHQVVNEQKNKYAVENKLNALVARINYQYNVGVDKNKLFLVDSNSFDKILYIKEITRVQNVDSFIYYLHQILSTIYAMPTRLCVVESYYATGKPKLYPNLVPHYALRERDVIQGDILMLGLQPKLMQDILRNASNISILIVLDRGGYEYPHIKGDNVEYFYTASDLEDVPKDIPKTRVISYSEDTLNIPYIDGFEKMDSSRKIAEYSSLPIVKKIISVLEGNT